MENLYTVPSLENLVTNGSNHWMLRPPDQVSKTEYWLGTKILFVATSDDWGGNHWLPQKELLPPWSWIIDLVPLLWSVMTQMCLST